MNNNDNSDFVMKFIRYNCKCRPRPNRFYNLAFPTRPMWSNTAENNVSA